MDNGTKCSATCTTESVKPSRYLATAASVPRSPPLSPSLQTPSIDDYTAGGPIPLSPEGKTAQNDIRRSKFYQQDFGSQERLSNRPETVEPSTYIDLSRMPAPRRCSDLPFTYTPSSGPRTQPSTRKQKPKRSRTTNDASHGSFADSGQRSSVK